MSNRVLASLAPSFAVLASLTPSLALLVPLAGCQLTPELNSGPSERASLGQAAYGILHDALAASAECPVEKVAELERSKDELVAAIDQTVTRDVENALPGLVGGALVPLVDSGELPRLTDALADTLAILVDDGFDPGRRIIASLVDAAHAPSVIASEHAMRLVSGMFTSGDAAAGLHALAALAQEPDGVDDVAGSTLDLVARVLGGPASPSMCGGIDTATLRADLLDTRGYGDDPALGAPAWAVRADKHGNPRVRIDPATGTLFAPFIDKDGDKVADVDALGRPVDAAGAPIDLPPLGTPGKRDAAKRALAPSGQLVYEYYDAKKTLLGAAVRIVRNALRARLHVHLAPIVDATLGPAKPCSDGPQCYAYGAQDNPLADLVHLLLEAARYDRAATLAQSWARALDQKPALAEATLVALGNVILAMDGQANKLTTDDLLGLLVDLSPLISEVLEKSPKAHESLTNLLLGVVAELGTRLGDPKYQKVVTQLLPILQAVVSSGALPTILELDRTLQQLPADDGNGTVLTATMDAVAFIVRPRTVSTRLGPVAGSSILVELLQDLRVVFARVKTGGATASLDAVLDHVLGYITKTEMVSGQERLVDRNVVPTLAAALATVGHLVDLPRATYECYVGQLQQGATQALTGRNFATLMRVVRQVGVSPSGDALVAWVATMLDPAPADPKREAYGPMVAFAAGVVDSPRLYGALDEVVRFAGEVASRRREDGGELMGVLDKLVVADEGGVVPQLLANLTAEDASDAARPLTVLVGFYRRIDDLRASSSCQPVARPMAPGDLERIVRSTADFLRDEQGGLRAIYALIGKRSK